MKKGRPKARRGSNGPKMRKAILNIATEVTGRKCFIIVCVDSSHSCGRLLKKACKRATMFPETVTRGEFINPRGEFINQFQVNQLQNL